MTKLSSQDFMHVFFRRLQGWFSFILLALCAFWVAYFWPYFYRSLASFLRLFGGFFKSNVCISFLLALLAGFSSLNYEAFRSVMFILLGNVLMLLCIV